MLQEQIKNYIETHGVKQTWICSKLGCSSAMLTLWLQGKRKLRPKSIEILENLISK